MIFPVIMAGGSGTRLWPLSRQLNPKQFLSLVEGSRSMLQATVKRLPGIEASELSLVCNEKHRFLAAEQLRQAGHSEAHIILEPECRNTAPAIALCAIRAVNVGQDPVLLVLAADHLIRDQDIFQMQVLKALPLAEAGKLITFGVVPGHAETGYGYIHRGQAVNEDAFSVARFVEKPDQETAEGYVASGEYFWNSGMFMFRASVMLKALEAFAPDVLTHSQAALANASLDLGFTRLDAAAFAASPSIAIDVAVMEKTDQAATVAADMGWSDLGSWEALHGFADKDSNGNALQGKVQLRDTRNSYFRSDDGRLLTGIGVEDMIVVSTADAVLVAPLARAGEVKDLVSDLSALNAPEADLHRKVSRPWGTYQDIDRDDGFRAKRIVVHPGGRLSLQRHRQRSEHWVVVKGTAHVTIDGVETVLTRNQSTYVSIGATHRLENKSNEPLHLIEVQVGDYVEENDIERLDDVYGRTT